MNTIPLLCTSALWLAGALSALAPSARVQEAPDDARTFAAAMGAHWSSHWTQSCALLVPLADRGHVEASRIASQMHRWGPRLYGQRLAAGADQLARWQLHARCAAAPAPQCTLTAKAP